MDNIGPEPYTLSLKRSLMSTGKPNHAAGYWDWVAKNKKGEVTCDLWRRHADNLNAELVRRFLQPSPSFSRVLKTDLFDESIGMGLLPSLSEISGEVAGIDVSYNTALSASRNLSCGFSVNADVRAPSFKARSFDLILSNSTLDHFSTDDEIRKSLRSMALLLKPGGHLIWTMDNPSNPLIRIRNALSSRFGTIGDLLPYRMGKTWNLRQMTSEISCLGLEVRHTASIMHCPRLLVIPILKHLEKKRKVDYGGRLLKKLQALEKLESLPTRRVSSHYSAVHAVMKS